MASPAPFNKKSPTIRRILQEAAELSTSASPDYGAEPLEEDLFEWHFTFCGPPNSDYSEGIYHGKIILPPTYPLRPPTFKFMTPSGRFEVNREICLSISGHHEETWQPAWGIRTALVALRSFMETDSHAQLGGLEATPAARKQFAARSVAWKCAVCKKSNKEIIAACKEKSRDEASPAADETVPEQLNLRWKDDMPAKTEKSRDSPTIPPAEPKSKNPELPAQTVQTIVSPAATNEIRSRRPAQVAPSVTQQRQPASAQVQAQGSGTVWIDRAIVLLAIALAALLAKVMFEL